MKFTEVAEDDIAYYFAFNLKLMGVFGLRSQNYDKGSGVQQTLEKLPTYATNIWEIAAIASEVWYMREALQLNNSSLAAKIFGQLIINVQCICKGFQLANAVTRTRSLLADLTKSWNKNKPKGGFRESIINEAQQVLFICKVYFACAVAIMVTFGMPLMINIVHYYPNRHSTNHSYDFTQRISLLKYPVEINNVQIYIMALINEAYLLFVSCMFWVSSDTLFVQLITHICLQYKILQYDIEKMINQEVINYNLQRNFVNFIKRHVELLRISEEFGNIYSPVIFISMLAAAINICINVIALKVSISRGDYEETGLYIFLTMGVFCQVLLYCTFAEKLTQESMSIGNSFYSSSWPEKHHAFRYYLQIIIMRAQKPFYCTALGFFQVGHKQLSSIINTTFSYYMMLEAVGS